MHTPDVDITPKIVALYCESLLAALDTPEAFVNALVLKLQAIIRIHGLIMIVEPEQSNNRKETGAEHRARIQIPVVRPTPHTDPSVKVEQIQRGKGGTMLEDLIERGQKDLEHTIATRYPDNVGLHSHWFRIHCKPRIAVCIFRAQMPEDMAMEFSSQEQCLLGSLEEHIGICIRVHAGLTRSRRDSFDFFADICREIATTNGLTNSESRVLRSMVAGSTNKEICNELQISLATVKTHISHILQKTGCRNRADLIGKYFSSRKAMMR